MCVSVINLIYRAHVYGLFLWCVAFERVGFKLLAWFSCDFVYDVYFLLCMCVSVYLWFCLMSFDVVCEPLCDDVCFFMCVLSLCAC